MTHEPSKEKLVGISLTKMPHGGYVVFRGLDRDDYGYRSELASFSTLPEAISWISQNMEVQS